MPQLKPSSLSRLLWWSQEAWTILTNRTPRSTSRRASRQLRGELAVDALVATAAGEVGAFAVNAVHVERLAAFAREVDQFRRGADCMRKASS